MYKQFTKRLSSVSPRAAIAGALIIAVVISGVTLLLTRGGSEVNANAAMQPHAARLDRVDGSVGIARAEDEDKELDWTEASVNTPITVGDRIYARDYANASIALTGHNYVRLNPATSLDVLALDDRRTQFALRSGSALFDVGALDADDLYEVATPCGAVDFKEPGLYQVGMDGGNAIISVLNGLAQVVGQDGSGYISKGQVFTLEGATAQALASTLAADTAGEIVDDYYRYRYPKVYNGRYRSYDAYLAEPSYYDSYRSSVSYQYLPVDIPGLYDLDDYGDWVEVNDYGYCWAPRVSAGWAPFRSGYWDLDDRWGPSWVSSESWGWAPYHYGRWTFVNQRWFWVPTDVRTRVVYYPAPVAFIPFADQIAWVPLGPGEVYVPRYYDNYRPQYLASAEVVRLVTVQNTFVNFNAPGALTVVPVRSFTRVIDPSGISPVDAVVVGKSRAVIDPFSVAGVRELATRHDDGRRRIKFDRREQEVLGTAVVASATPQGLPARGDLAKRLKVEAAPENRRELKLNIKNADQVTGSRRPDGLPQPMAQSQRMSELASRAEQGDKSARREMRQLMREEQRTIQQRPQAPAQIRTPQEQSRQQMKQQRRAEQQGASSLKPDATQAQQQQQMKQQRKAERQQQAAPAAQKQTAPQRQQMKQQRKVERQKSEAGARQHQQQQMRQQKREQKRKPPEASVQQQVRQVQRESARSRMAQEAWQSKAQRRADVQRRATSEGMNRRAVTQATQQAQAREQVKAQRRPERQQAAMQQQQSTQRQAAPPPTRRAPAYLGPPVVKQDAASQSPRKAEKGQRKPPQ